MELADIWSLTTTTIKSERNFIWERKILHLYFLCYLVLSFFAPFLFIFFFLWLLTCKKCSKTNDIMIRYLKVITAQVLYTNHRHHFKYQHHSARMSVSPWFNTYLRNAFWFEYYFRWEEVKKVYIKLKRNKYLLFRVVIVEVCKILTLNKLSASKSTGCCCFLFVPLETPVRTCAISSFISKILFLSLSIFFYSTSNRALSHGAIILHGLFLDYPDFVRT